MLLVEQNAFHALKLAHRGYVMVNGRIALSGAVEELLARPEMKAAYLEGAGVEEPWAQLNRLYVLPPTSDFSPVTVVLGGGAAFLAGQAIAATWRPWWHVPGTCCCSAGAVRFLHFALFGGRCCRCIIILVDTVFCAAVGFLGFRAERVAAEVTAIRLALRAAACAADGARRAGAETPNQNPHNLFPVKRLSSPSRGGLRRDELPSPHAP